MQSFLRVGPSAAIVALIGVAAMLHVTTLQAIFVGATLTATSVAISARVLSDLGRLQSREGNIILGAAVLDDILGLVILSVMVDWRNRAPSRGRPLHKRPVWPFSF